MRFVKILIGMSLLLTLNCLYGENVEKQGKDILEKADKRFYPDEGSVDLSITTDDTDGVHREYKLQYYKKGTLYQTIVFITPEINKNDVGMRSGDTIYYKQSKWPKPDIMSYQAAFMESGFSWGDVVTSDIAIDYKVTKIENIKDSGKDVFYLVLSPNKTGLYARIDTWIDSTTYDTYKRLYFTASGEQLKIATYSDIESKEGVVVSFKVDMKDFITETKSTAGLSNIKKEKLPRFLFDPQNIGRIHVK